MKPIAQIITGVVIILFLATCARKNVFDEPPDHPVIDSIFPASGIKGTQIRLYGTGFSTLSSTNSVSINGIPVRVDSPSTSTVLLVTVTDSTGTGAVHVDVNNKEAVGPIFTYLVDVNSPFITSLSPLSGWVDTTVTIKGINFGTDASKITVKFNGHPATKKKTSDTLITVAAPLAATNGTPGDAIVTVTVADKTSNGVKFTYAEKAIITKAAFGWADGSGYAVNVSNMPANDADIQLLVNGKKVTIEHIVRPGHQFYIPSEGDQLLIGQNDTVLQHVPVNFADFTMVSGGINSNTVRLQIRPRVDDIQSRYGGFIFVAGDTLTITGRFFGDKTLPSSVVFFQGGELSPSPQIISWTTTSIKIKVPAYSLAAGTNLPVSVRVAQEESYSYVGTYYAAITATATVLAGSGEAGFVNGTGINAQFNGPFGIAVDGDGMVYVSDESNHRIRMITPQGVVTTYAGSTAGFKEADGEFAQFNRPQGLAMDANKALYVADASNNRIRIISPGRSVTTFAGTSSPAEYFYPSGVALGAYGNVYVADMNNHRVRDISPPPVSVTNIGSSPAGFADGALASAKFNQPYGVTCNYPPFGTISFKQTIFVADAGNHRIRRIYDGQVTTLAGSGTAGKKDGVGTAAQFDLPRAMTMDLEQKNLYVVDFYNGFLRKIDLQGVVTTVVAENPEKNAIVSFIAPTGIAIDAQGNLYVTDYGTHQVYKITLK